MNYNEALNFIEKKQSLGIMPGLSRILELLDKMGNPQNKIKIIHIAGTNGKGTVAKNIADALIENGCKVGLFTSPWVIDYREQIQLNNEFISKEDFAKYVEEYKNNDCSEFELLSAIMFKYFADNEVDYAVVECGLGGRDDATNVENENLSVITSISYDHMNYLGNTLEEIAENKSGILRKNSACIIYGDEFQNIFENKCKKLIISPQSDNLSIVNTALRYLGYKEIKALKSLPARQERIKGILLDGSHNEAAGKMLEPLIDNEVALIGMMKDKEVEKYLSIIAPKCKRIIATTVNNPRAMKADELFEIAKKYCSDVCICEDAKRAIENEKITLICGSFYLAREVRNLI